MDEKLSNIFEKICIEKQGSIHEEKEKDAFDHLNQLIEKNTTGPPLFRVQFPDLFVY